jgi:hypothetical protein
MKSTIFVDITPCRNTSLPSFGSKNKRHCFHAYSTILKMKAIFPPETSVDFQRATRRCNPPQLWEPRILHSPNWCLEYTLPVFLIITFCYMPDIAHYVIFAQRALNECTQTSQCLLACPVCRHISTQGPRMNYNKIWYTHYVTGSHPIHVFCNVI